MKNLNLRLDVSLYSMFKNVIEMFNVSVTPPPGSAQSKLVSSAERVLHKQFITLIIKMSQYYQSHFRYVTFILEGMEL